MKYKLIFIAVLGMAGAAFLVPKEAKPFVHSCTAVNTPSSKVEEATSTDEVQAAPEIVHKVHSALKENILAKERKNELSKKRSEQWWEIIHKAAPGDDWRAIEAESIAEMIARAGSAGNRDVSGTWVERGPSNIPGRITDVDIDFENNRIYALSDHGIVFQSSDLEATAWSAQNDRFPLGLDVASQLEVFAGGDLVTSGYIKAINKWGVFYSKDHGLTWTAASGLDNLPVMGYRRLLKGGNDVYLLAQEYSGAANSDYYKIYKSTDHGVSFRELYVSPIPVGDGGRHVRSDMWISNNPLNENIYVSLEDSLFLVNKSTGVRTFNSLVTKGNHGYHLLTGHESNGVVVLRAYSSQGDVGKFYGWNSNDNEWVSKGQLTEWWLSQPFGANSFACSPLDADVLYFGGILVSKSEDGGETWTTMDLDPTGSYALYHGDVPKCFTAVNPATNEEVMLIGTDGGLYQLDMPTQHFEQMGIPGLNCTQLYKMVSRQADPGTMYIGTQDNGYSHTTKGNAQQEAVDFTFQWGGDVSNVASGDGGETFWLWWLGDGCNYQQGPAEAGFVSNWSPYDVDGQVPYWEAPIWVSGHFPDRCYTAGYINGTGGNHLIQLTSQPGARCLSKQFDYNFETAVGGRITAIAISPIDSNYFYVTTDNGFFCRSTDGGITWHHTLISSSLYPRAILPSKQNADELWVVGSGYSNSPVFHSLDNGNSWEALNIGLPACIAEAITTNDDESMIFLATSVGPFVWETDQNQWSDLSDNVAPLVHYMDVEYLTTTHTVRFATYARGIWDYQLKSFVSADDVAENNSGMAVFPNPCADHINVNLGEGIHQSSYVIYDVEGRVVLTGIASSNTERIETAGLSGGVYFIKIAETGGVVRFVKE